MSGTRARGWLSTSRVCTTATSFGALAALVVACGGSTATPTTAATAATPTPTPSLLAPVSSAVSGQPIDGITCDPSATLALHVHAHLAIFVSGTPRAVPKNIGVLASLTGTPCTYWLHSHDDDGIMHVETPMVRAFTLGNYFDIWGIPLDSTHVGPAGGTVITYLNGQRYAGNVRDVPLAAHNLVQLDVNGNVPPAAYSFPEGD